jgi:hypothetical protein
MCEMGRWGVYNNWHRGGEEFFFSLHTLSHIEFTNTYIHTSIKQQQQQQAAAYCDKQSIKV